MRQQKQHFRTCVGACGQASKRGAQITNTTRLDSRSESVPITECHPEISKSQRSRSALNEGEGRIAAEIPLSEERVKVGKRTVGAGEVRVRKNVSIEQVNVPVELLENRWPASPVRVNYNPPRISLSKLPSIDQYRD